MIRPTTSLAALAMALAVVPASAQTVPTPGAALTQRDVDAFVAAAERQLAAVGRCERISWVNETFITDDT